MADLFQEIEDRKEDYIVDVMVTFLEIYNEEIRDLLAELKGQEFADGVRILYGGSVKPENVGEIMSQPDVDGGLVGGASLEADSFLALVEEAQSAAV